jgi:hypothetical protein
MKRRGDLSLQLLVVDVHIIQLFTHLLLTCKAIPY